MSGSRVNAAFALSALLAWTSAGCSANHAPQGESPERSDAAAPAGGNSASAGTGAEPTAGSGGVGPTDAGMDAQPAEAGAPAAGSAGASGNAGSSAGEGGAAGSSEQVALDGTWIGSVESYTFPSGSNAFTLDLQTKPHLTGQVVFGEAPAEPAPDPADVLDTVEFQIVRERYAYTVLDASLDGDRLRFRVDGSEVWRGFCSTLQPIDSGDDRYRCVPPWSFSAMPSDVKGHCYLTNPATGRNEEVHCGQFWFCMLGYCTCDATACRAQTRGSVRFDVVIRDGEMHGMIDGVLSQRVVQLEKR